MQPERKGRKIINITPEQSQTYEINGTVISVEPKFKNTGNNLLLSLSKMVLKDFLEK